jgi:hypothetical protein
MVLGLVSAEKQQRVDPYFSNFSFQILVDYPFSANIIFNHHQVALITLCGKGIKQSQSPRETDYFESNFQPCKANLTHTLGTSNDDSEATVCLSFRLVDQCHHKRL